MGATEEQMALLANAHVTHVSYILILYSVAFVLFLCKMSIPILAALMTSLANFIFVSVVNMLLHLYEIGTRDNDSKEYESVSLPNGHPLPAAEQQRVRDAEEFELEGLMTDDEDDHRERRVKQEGSYSQST